MCDDLIPENKQTTESSHHARGVEAATLLLKIKQRQRQVITGMEAADTRVQYSN